MRAVVQRVREARVVVDGIVSGSINKGLLIYLGIGTNDDEQSARQMLDKIVNLRIFEDSGAKMNLSLRDVSGELLVVSQFTLYADTRKGRRPSYDDAAPPAKALDLYDHFVEIARETGIPTESGVFKASMDVTYTNEGPVTILLDSEKKF